MSGGLDRPPQRSNLPASFLVKLQLVPLNLAAPNREPRRDMPDSTDSKRQVRQKPTSLSTWLGVDRGPIALASTDIVGATEMAIAMRDRSWINVLMDHFKKPRHYPDLNGGYEVKL